ncbi:hypothetical protein T9A_02729 [Alcanivorax jadensis T9]|uniref:PepSY-associated TM helix domain-containing protein n=2 Tax=Alcanivoracaceae TaxID=224372 RepID=A0ABR4WAS9_9GAMM|nr:hypothetical protein T9A_02729 [Alcanivorax jadensis T9]
MDRMKLMKAHALLAAFIFPAAIMFMVTGALYTWSVKGGYKNDVYEVKLSKPVQSNLSELINLAQLELDDLVIEYPEGQPKLKAYGSHFLLEWTGSSKDVVLEPTEDPLIAKLTVKRTDWYRSLVQLHKAKGGIAFKFYAVVLAISIVALLVSGFIMAWQTPKLKRVTLITSFAGLFSFFVFVFLS